MKKIVFLFATMLFVLSCKEEPKEQIHLGDYNHPETERMKDTATVDSTSTDSTTAIDSTTVDTSTVVKKKKTKKEEEK